VTYSFPPLASLFHVFKPFPFVRLQFKSGSTKMRKLEMASCTNLLVGHDEKNESNDFKKFKSLIINFKNNI
jgi:hypothetical protein